MQLSFTFDKAGSLELKGATFSMKEFEALDHVFRKAGLGVRLRFPSLKRRIKFRDLGKDRSGRFLRSYIINGKFVKRLEKILGGHFEYDGTFKPIDATGQGYSCREITMDGFGDGCENLVARDDSIALVKCALIAGRNLWFGGVADLGSCAGEQKS